MSTGVIVEPFTYSSKNFSDSFFFKEPVDLKYTSSRYHTFSPINSLTEAKKIDFSIPSFNVPSLWNLNNSYIEVGFKVTDLEGELPKITEGGASEVIGPINNALHSMFKDVKLYLNGIVTYCIV